MYVGRIMCTDLVTVPLTTTLAEADEILKEKKINHLIVKEGSRLAGIISDRDLKLNQASPATTLSAHELNYLLGQITVGMIMVKNVITVSPDTTVERAAFIMREQEISSLPVMENKEVVGIITTTDVVDILLEAIGLQEECQRLIVLIRDQPGAMAEITGTLARAGINLQSLVTWPEKGQKDLFQVVIRVAVDVGEKAVKALEQKGYKVLTHYVKDHQKYISER